MKKGKMKEKYHPVPHFFHKIPLAQYKGVDCPLPFCFTEDVKFSSMVNTPVMHHMYAGEYKY